MKIQELLNKHKDKLWDWWYNQLVIDKEARENYKWIIIDWRVNDNPMSEFSLTDLLFDTPFLSLLEWKEVHFEDCDKWWLDYERYVFWIKSDYHKINLVLLSTDEERIFYLEDNTI